MARRTSASLQNGKSFYLDDPDEYFTKYSISEIKQILHRIRSDADAKQEELRLMVGERYRDLIQASSSIISIEASARNVQNSISVMKETISSGASLQARRKRKSVTSADIHLQTLQSLAAHLKLLIDSSEFLWRLLERQQYLHAAWLFLLSRVIYRSLTVADAENGVVWADKGINVQEQFPIVERQWETVSQFRTQISQKATLSLREDSSSCQAVCAALLTLYLLDSAPLADTLDTFLKQRSRSIHIHMAPFTESENKTSEAPQKPHVREITGRLQRLLEVITHTVHTAREVFSTKDSSSSSMITEVLRAIQLEAKSSLTTELCPTTQSLLASMPSSTYFLLLPADIKQYRPYIDLSSPSSVVKAEVLQEMVSVWFGRSLEKLEAAFGKVFAIMSSVKDAWTVYTCLTRWISAVEGLLAQEQEKLIGLVEAACNSRVKELWVASLDTIKSTFKAGLLNLAKQIQEDEASSQLDVAPAKFILSAPPIPSAFQSGSTESSMSAAFQRYKNGIEQRLIGRTPGMDSILTELETTTGRLRQDLEVAIQSDRASELLQQYDEDANSSAAMIVDEIAGWVDGDESDPNVRHDVVAGRLLLRLSVSSALMDLRCSEKILNQVQARLSSHRERVTSRWRSAVVASALQMCNPPALSTATQQHQSFSVSPSLMKALLHLVTSVQQWGVVRDRHHVLIARDLLADFGQKFPRQSSNVESGNSLATLRDAVFLRTLCEQWSPELQDVVQSLDETIATLHSSDNAHVKIDELKRGASECRLRLHALLSSLSPASAMIPPKAMKSLPSAAPQKNAQPIMELAKTSTRFGSLLVGGGASL